MGVNSHIGFTYVRKTKSNTTCLYCILHYFPQGKKAVLFQHSRNPQDPLHGKTSDKKPLFWSSSTSTPTTTTPRPSCVSWNAGCCWTSLNTPCNHTRYPVSCWNNSRYLLLYLHLKVLLVVCKGYIPNNVVILSWKC